MPLHHFSLCALPPRVTPLFQLCTRCEPSHENPNDYPGRNALAQRPCLAGGKAVAADRRCHYKIRV